MNYWTQMLYIDIETGELITKKDYINNYKTVKNETYYTTANNVTTKHITKFGKKGIAKQLKLF